MADDALTRKEAGMGRLTREEIEAAHDALCAAVALNLDMSKEWCEQKWEQAHMLRDLALRALSLESVREEVSEEEIAWLVEMPEGRWGTGYFWHIKNLGEWGVIEDATRLARKEDAEAVIAALHASNRYAKEGMYVACEHRWSALQHAPARVAEGHDPHALPDDNAEVAEAIAPESPAKEQPGEQYRRGFEDGVRAYAWYKDGVQEVGTTGRTLRQALVDVEKTWNYSPPPPERP